MATMVKEKRKEKKKKTKEKYLPNLELKESPSVNFIDILESGSSPLANETEIIKPIEILERSSDASNVVESVDASKETRSQYINMEKNIACISEETEIVNNENVCTVVSAPRELIKHSVETTLTLTGREQSSATVNLEWENAALNVESIGNTYEYLNSRLKRMFMPVSQEQLSSGEIDRLHTPEAHFKPICDENVILDQSSINPCEVTEETVPSAPMVETEESHRVKRVHEEKFEQVVKNKVPCMPVEEAIRLYGGKEMEELRVLSEREEAVVEAGAVTGPEHPLVDLLSTFRSSLAAVERERTQLARSFIEEEKYRTSLWKIEKRYINQSEICKCGTSVDLSVTYEHAELLRDKLPVARMKLEAILKDVQESYCHHQHAALLAHCQIEEFIAETIESNKNEIREALTLILQALRLSEGSPTALSSALQRWAQALARALLDGGDIKQLLFFVHHLFRQTRSVRWAARLIHLQVGDSCEAAQMIALLDLLISRPRLESAVECTEDSDEAWEEVDKHGSGGAVSEGALRERDLLELLYAFPLRDLVARIILFTRSEDITDISESSWGDRAGGRGVIKAACGIRALLVTCARACTTHNTYSQLRDALHELVASALYALAGLHLHSRNFYSKDLEERIMAELEACFALGFTIMDADKLYKLPTTLLDDDTASDYCVSFITSLHDKSSKRMQLLDVDTPLCACSVRVRIVAQATLDRTVDHQLAAIVLDFLIQTGVKRKTSPCKVLCDATAREWLPRLLHTHPYFYASALHILAEINQGDPLDPSSVEPLALHQWRPTCMEVQAILSDWSCRCSHLLQHLLLQLDYTPHTGISLKCQLSIGAWLCQYVQASASEPPEWMWNVLRRLHLHRTSWNMPLDAPPPDEPKDLFATAYALLSSSWGHCIPLICEYGVAALCRVATTRPRDATFCLAPIMLVMAHSPESVSLTPKFTEFFNILLGSGPTLMQRALGRGGEPGSTLLLRLILAQLEHDRYSGISQSALVSAWLHALWRSTLPAVSLSLLDTALLARGDYPQLDRHATLLVQEQNSKDHVDHVVRNAHLAPLLCESVLRARHTAFELNTQLSARLNDVVTRQRMHGQKIHVDNAFKQIGANMCSEELVLYRTATAVLLAPLTHPSHLALWRLFFHLYLQRPPYGSQESSLAVGPLFFSGHIKSRILSQLKKRLQETATYHQNEIKKRIATRNIEQSPRGSSNRVVKSSSIVIEDNLLPALSLVDLTGQSSESSDSDSDNGAKVTRDNRREGSRDSESSESYHQELIQYHIVAEKMVRMYSQWLEEGERVLAFSVHAQSLPEQLLDVACRDTVSQSRAPADPSGDDSLPTRTSPLPVHTPLEKTVATLMMFNNGPRRRSRRVAIQSSVEDVNFKDVRSLLDRVDKHLKNIERLANDWSSEASRVTSLDVQLWDLVSELRVGRPVMPMKKQCSNKCKPITFIMQATEWCISTGAEKGIKENRRSAYVALRRLARARPHAAVTAAALNTIARRIQTGEAATKVLDRAWRTTGVAANCAPAHLALTALVTDLAERWVCHDGRITASLVSRWCSGGVAQRALIGSLVSPRRVPAADWPPLYMALLRAADSLPSHNVFSYLSKFELNRWSTVASPSQRREMLEALTVAACRWGFNPDSQHHVLLELIGVHTAILTNTQDLCALVTSSARASVAAALPATHWRHIVQAADLHATSVTFDQLGHLLRELGVIWWESRTMSTSKRCDAHYVAYAPHIAALLHTLQRAFVGAAMQLSYDPDRVALYAWSSLCESWGPWISPHPAAPPLLPCTGEGEEYTAMLRHFVDNVHQVMIDCPGSENHLLQQIFEWMIQTYVGASSSHSHDSRVQLSSLLAELTKLPWGEHQWMHSRCIQHVLQICTNVDEEITTWVSHALRSVTSEAWLHGIEPAHAPAHLATLLYLLTTMPLQLQTLEEATRLPWWMLPEVAMEQALERFFADHHNPTQPYYSLPQFRVVLFASGLICNPSVPAQAVASASARFKRACAVSLCVRAASSPALHTHLRAHTDTMLDVIQTLASISEIADDEIEELLSRAVVILCMESAAATALPVWEHWVCGAAGRVRAACVRAARACVVLDHYALLADAAARAHLQHTDSSGWPDVRDSWQAIPWSEASALVTRGKLHAAYGTVLARAHSPRDLRATIQALLATSINFVEDEVIVAVWICHTCRVACTQRVGGSEIEDCGAIARALLAQWAEEPRLAILRVITLRAAGGTPTARHRLLCRFAQCVLTPNIESAVRAYETSCSSVLGSNTDLITWAKAPNPKRLPRLAVRLYPNFERYFLEELNMAPDES